MKSESLLVVIRFQICIFDTLNTAGNQINVNNQKL